VLSSLWDIFRPNNICNPHSSRSVGTPLWHFFQCMWFYTTLSLFRRYWQSKRHHIVKHAQLSVCDSFLILRSPIIPLAHENLWEFCTTTTPDCRSYSVACDPLLAILQSYAYSQETFGPFWIIASGVEIRFLVDEWSQSWQFFPLYFVHLLGP
jgi:hypothetical protein